MDRNLFERFAPALARLGVGDEMSPSLQIASDGRYSLQYTPFEYVNTSARLVIVGITPGPNQLVESYAEARKQLQYNLPVDQMLHEIKKVGAFGGATMRPNLVRMLHHFHVAELLGIAQEADLWGRSAQLFDATSVIPHAVFKGDKKFSGSFAEVLKSNLLRECFEDCFVASIREMTSESFYLGLGPTAEDALTWCVLHGYLRDTQLLGAIPHPSTESGSQVDYFVGKMTLADLKPKDPVRNRVQWLDAAARRLSERVLRLAAG